jgi:hypothetical protein
VKNVSECESISVYLYIFNVIIIWILFYLTSAQKPRIKNRWIGHRFGVILNLFIIDFYK